MLRGNLILPASNHLATVYIQDPPTLESQEQPPIIPPPSIQASQLSSLSQKDVCRIAAVVAGLVQPHGASQQNPRSSTGVLSADLSAASSSTITTVAGK